MPQEKAAEFTAAEKKAIAEYYEDRRDELEGKFDTASKLGESTRDKAFNELAEQLTAMGVAVRTVKPLKVKLKSMKQRARERSSEPARKSAKRLVHFHMVHNNCPNSGFLVS